MSDSTTTTALTRDQLIDAAQRALRVPVRGGYASSTAGPASAMRAASSPRDSEGDVERAITKVLSGAPGSPDTSERVDNVLAAMAGSGPVGALVPATQTVLIRSVQGAKRDIFESIARLQPRSSRPDTAEVKALKAAVEDTLRRIEIEAGQIDLPRIPRFDFLLKTLIGRRFKVGKEAGGQLGELRRLLLQDFDNFVSIDDEAQRAELSLIDAAAASLYLAWQKFSELIEAKKPESTFSWRLSRVTLALNVVGETAANLGRAFDEGGYTVSERRSTVVKISEGMMPDPGQTSLTVADYLGWLLNLAEQADSFVRPVGSPALKRMAAEADVLVFITANIAIQAGDSKLPPVFDAPAVQGELLSLLFQLSDVINAATA